MKIEKVHQGFTLIELLIVLVIMVGVAGVVAPAVSKSMDSTKLNSSARELVGLLKHYRNLSIYQGKPVKLTVDSELREYRSSVSKKVYRWMEGVDVAFKSDDFSINESDFIEFYPDGTSSGADLIVHNDRREFHISVNWITGRVTLNDA